MANYNKVILLGNLTRDPQLSYTPNQTAVVNFGLAINRKWTGQDGQKHEETCFVDCTAFGKTGENINKYCKKGNPLFVEGRLNFSSWTAQDGTKRSKLKVVVDSFQFIGSAAGASAAGQNSSRQQAPQNPSPQDENQAAGNDDIPF